MYRLKEYLNITRCFKCHGYGHIAKNCGITEQLCETCGSKDHMKEKWKAKTPKCINFVRSKRSSTDHAATDKKCSVYAKYVELIKKIKINKD